VTPLSDLRFLDQVALAFERGMKTALASVPHARLKSIGALVEVAVMAQSNRDLTSLFRRFEKPGMVRALKAAQISPLEIFGGRTEQGTYGFMSLNESSADDLREPVYGLQLAARKAMHFQRDSTRTKAKLSGAIEEMIDNVLDHSGKPTSGLIAFFGTEKQFEAAIGDAGMGVLASLQTNPKFSYLQDAGTAMSVAIQDGNSRHGPVLDRGYGFGTLFRALNSIDAAVRLRSGDYALETSGRSPTERTANVSQKATLRGFVVSMTLHI